MTAPESSKDLSLLDRQERRELLTAYLDGELSAEQALHVSTWLDDNAGALREVEHLRHIWDLLDVYEDEPVPEQFAAGVFEAVGIEREERPVAAPVISMAWYRRPMATAAAVLLAVGATVLVMSDRGVRSPEPASPPADTANLEAVGVDYLDSLDVLVDADDETFEEFLAGGEIADLTTGG